ncbi:hypothetical protein BO71DRAFT_430693 [Aspergillus ellipticus CBS 707.79]|uniref:Uncharacterized protein n=1 Tax=Aspergillus ellipticus CBS 707.79 TaxID=1448320 RepID=A0A319D9E0_9EURO|nr:hypothetical protein BO71DRAFT_430693 [Aspergillus ellipticus CBS 707.79]
MAAVWLQYGDRLPRVARSGNVVTAANHPAASSPSGIPSSACPSAPLLEGDADEVLLLDLLLWAHALASVLFSSFFFFSFSFSPITQGSGSGSGIRISSPSSPSSPSLPSSHSSSHDTPRVSTRPFSLFSPRFPSPSRSETGPFSSLPRKHLPQVTHGSSTTGLFIIAIVIGMPG